MLHELLLALLGYTGDLIIDEREHQETLRVNLSPDAPLSDEPTFRLAPDISFVQSSDREVIERVITLGFYYRELERFAAKSRNLSWIRSSNESPLSRATEILKAKKVKPSVYRRALANGIVEVLSVYRSAVLQIEQKLLSDSLPILATVTQGLNKFFVLLPPLYGLILEIERDNIYGGRLLNLLHKRCHCGVPELQTCIQRFLEESRLLMRLPPRQSTAEADLMVPFQLAAIKTIGEEDKYFSRVSLRMPGITLKSSHVELPKPKAYSDGDSGINSDTSMEMSVDGWDGIALEYSVDWPLHLFFTQEVLSKYLRIFQYLLRLKRTQMELEKSWASAMHQDHSDFAKRHNKGAKGSIFQQRRQRFRPMWRVREHMAFLIRNLQFYIQVDVIESQWNVLQAHIQNSRDFTELVGFHQEYLSALISQSFLDIGSVSRILDGIMKLCWQFCWKIENQENKESTTGLEHIAEAPFLRRFLLRLNFNSFFETTAKGVLNVVRPRPTLAPGTI
ncbi:Gamma-tubulin complex component 4 [Orobanche minor]